MRWALLLCVAIAASGCARGSVDEDAGSTTGPRDAGPPDPGADAGPMLRLDSGSGTDAGPMGMDAGGSCGDGVVTPPEECDDMGESASCDADCTMAACGDGTLNAAAMEQCDDGGESASCNADCTTASCGDGVVNMTAGEDCDEMGETMTCDADCTTVACTDGTINATAGEVCEPGMLGGEDCTTQGFDSGMLACASDCASYDTSGCMLSCTSFGTDGAGVMGCSSTPAVLPCDDVSGTGVALGLSDDGEATASIGFTFTWHGVGHSSVRVGSNGAMYFATTGDVPYTNACLPSGRPSPTILALWDDWDPGGVGDVYTQTLGTAPNRRFVVQWQAEHYPSSTSTADVRVMLHEGTNLAQVCYVDTVFGSATYDDGASATVGIEDGANSLEFSCNAANVPSGLLIEYR